MQPERIYCPECDTDIEEPVADQFCETCGWLIDEDVMRDQLEAQAEPPEDERSDR